MPADSPAKPQDRRRPPVAMPDQISVFEGPPPETEAGYRDHPPGERGQLVIVRRWYQKSIWVFVAFSIFWDGFLFKWYADAMHEPLGLAILTGGFAIVHVAVGLFVTYLTIASFFNRTTITVTDRDLTIRHGPFPWRGNRRIAAKSITQLFCEEQVTQGKSGPHRTYHLSAVLDDGKKLRLIPSWLTAEQALFIEERIEDRLGIVDAPVEGEYKG